MLVENSTAESSSSANLSTSVGSNVFVALQSSSSINVSEFELALKALPMKVHASTAAIYRMPLEHWKYPYTVGPTEFVIASFKEFVFKQTYIKSVSVETDVRTQIGLRTEDNKERQLTLLQSREVGWPSSKKTKEAIELLKYKHDLVYDKVQTNIDRAAHYVIRDSYKSGKLIRVLKSLWTSDSKSGLCEMFSISSCHHILLRDQDLRNLNFAYCFCTIIPKKQHKEMQQALALVFSLDKGKTLKEGKVKFACAICHENVFRCPFGAFAFFMFSLLQKTAKKALADEEIYTTQVIHGGRHAGSMEAEGLRISFDLIKQEGGWKDRLGRLETHYLGKLPSPFARGMAGFWEKPFSLARNGVSLPMELQKMKEMNEVDKNEDEDENIINLEIDEKADSVEFVEEDGRLQRIILQDAAIYLYLNKENKHIHTRNLPFSSNSFRMFQEDIIAAITSPSIGRLEEYKSLVPNIVNMNKEVANRVTEVNHRII
ncbi:hypothetical protein PHYBLDRAFT_153601 [Phycomyces blakesleeanus NRRL 1555(-)]|uniref:Ndc10 domain-containing protein n=1 Tax=Phycomyces blakesleeanus (strain ATCC 8743b / DSM 1359 / FGSC 10004 / NBRC 33097 / NRRL 1555) TaxID=763407 RepID=A0A163CSR3_PHYB8|nr:hypothetical protein PHYBLDRAFT_153601 [Phycomyces blakesleeanus NRRL 1555(-)]OAD65350.1 hypothetical protein PHYBLDRAFT_153601 [Phycomyces blakesleeanus NRRL 1555(-)]|eukprot:XP_018283390.1 hypothetical protein PHYBLDRAFT_153601 [Phycomyces blakesleeanus NRRL 1555(-)]